MTDAKVLVYVRNDRTGAILFAYVPRHRAHECARDKAELEWTAPRDEMSVRCIERIGRLGD